MAKALRFPCDLARIGADASAPAHALQLVVKLVPDAPHGHDHLTAGTQSGSIFFLSFRMNAMMLLSSSR